MRNLDAKLPWASAYNHIWLIALEYVTILYAGNTYLNCVCEEKKTKDNMP